MNKKIIATAFLGALFISQPAMAQGFSEHAGQSVGHSAQAIGHGLVGTAKLASAVVAVPLMAAGAVGEVSGKAGDSLMDASSTPIGAPLEVSDESVVAGPSPDQAIH